MSALDDAVAQASSLETTWHRPWPVPRRGWLMGQTWVQLLFAHWRVRYDALRPHVPEPLLLEQFDGSAWLGVTPFVLRGLRLHGLPPLPFLSTFGEVNCRTYVRMGDRPGIWFLSLDASSRLAVEAARRVYRLPYEWARITTSPTFEARRLGNSDVSVRAVFEPTGPPFEAVPGTLEHFLTERYCLYADGGRASAEIHHRPWQLQKADAEIEVSNLAPVPLDGPPLYHFAARQDVVVWRLERLRNEARSPG